MYKKIVIIGAPRSGTNILRDVLCNIDGVGTWPCDEINYIWRHGNVRFPSDEFTPDMATPEVVKYINDQTDKLAALYQFNFVVEKTCANSLRTNFVRAVFPDAYYIFIVRNGLDVVASANLRWTAKLDIPYLIKKVKYVPLIDLPFYAFRYFWSHIYRKFSGSKRLAFWGPVLNDLGNLLESYSLNQICAIQWKRCVEASEKDLNNIPADRIVRVRYEDFVQEPANELSRICRAFQIPTDSDSMASAVSNVSNKSVGNWRDKLSSESFNEIKTIVQPLMIKYGYDDDLT